MGDDKDQQSSNSSNSQQNQKTPLGKQSIAQYSAHDFFKKGIHTQKPSETHNNNSNSNNSSSQETMMHRTINSAKLLYGNLIDPAPSSQIATVSELQSVVGNSKQQPASTPSSSSLASRQTVEFNNVVGDSINKQHFSSSSGGGIRGVGGSKNVNTSGLSLASLGKEPLLGHLQQQTVSAEFRAAFGDFGQSRQNNSSVSLAGQSQIRTAQHVDTALSSTNSQPSFIDKTTPGSTILTSATYAPHSVPMLESDGMDVLRMLNDSRGLPNALLIDGADPTYQSVPHSNVSGVYSRQMLQQQQQRQRQNQQQQRQILPINQNLGSTLRYNQDSLTAIDPVMYLQTTTNYTDDIYGVGSGAVPALGFDSAATLLAQQNSAQTLSNEPISTEEMWLTHSNMVIEQEFAMSEAWSQAWAETTKANSKILNSKSDGDSSSDVEDQNEDQNQDSDRAIHENDEKASELNKNKSNGDGDGEVDWRTRETSSPINGLIKSKM